MKEPITRYVEDRYAKLNEFVSMQPDMSELPDFERRRESSLSPCGRDTTMKLPHITRRGR